MKVHHSAPKPPGNLSRRNALQDPSEAHPNLDAPLLLYIDGAKGKRPRWFRWLWRLSNASRLLLRRLPPRPKQLVTDLIALTVYWPLSRLASLAEAATAASTPSAPTPAIASESRWVGGSALFDAGALLVCGGG